MKSISDTAYDLWEAFTEIIGSAIVLIIMIFAFSFMLPFYVLDGIIQIIKRLKDGIQ